MPLAWFWLAVAAAALLAAVCLSDVVIVGRYRRVDGNDEGELVIRALYGLIRSRKTVKAFGWSWTDWQWLIRRGDRNVARIGREEAERFFRNTRRMLRLVYRLTDVVRRLVARLRVTEWEWHTAIGLKDAFWTAMMTGAAWALKAGIAGALSRRVRLCTRPAFRVEPLFGSPAFKTGLRFTARIRAGWLLLAGLVLFGRILRAGGEIKDWLKLLSQPERAEARGNRLRHKRSGPGQPNHA